MYEDILEKIRKSMELGSITAAFPKFSGENYKSIKIDIRHFHKINPIISDKKIAFIDGGNAEIISSSNFSLNLIRICYLTYQNNKKIAAGKFEIFAFVQAISQYNEIHYKVSFFKTQSGIQMDDLSFSSFDPTLMFGINRVEISSIGNAIRRFAELKLAKMVSDKKLAEIIVLDGNLQSTITSENTFFKELYESCSKNNVILTALSKTTSLLTDDGNMLSVVLLNISPLETWFYYPVVEIKSLQHQSEMLFVKFHEKSSHAFRFEIYNKQKGNAEEVINIISSNCVDPIFLGYPYGLVDADRMARVGNQEKEALKNTFLLKLRNKNFEKYLNSKNAHEILDRIRF